MKKLLGSFVAGAVMMSASYASAAATYQLVTPGTASQVAALVKASTSIMQLPATTKPSLVDASQSMTLNALTALGGKCPNAQTTCSFGALSSKKVVLLIGDSHALMWVPALVPSLAKAGYRLDLKWFPGCPIATFVVANPTDTQSRCATWRTNLLLTIKKSPPVAVIFSERTTKWCATNQRSVDFGTCCDLAVTQVGQDEGDRDWRHAGLQQRHAAMPGTAPNLSPGLLDGTDQFGAGQSRRTSR